MDNSDYIVLAVLGVLLLYGLGNFIAMPIVARRAYRDLGFTDQGQSMLESPAQSQLLKPLATSHLYGGQHQNYRLEHCKAHPIDRRKFTLSKARRKQNQARWSVTRLHCEKTLPDFCLLTTADVSTALMMLEDPGVDLSEDEDFDNRYHLRCAEPEKIKPLIFGELKEFLLMRELISIECVADTILVKRAWPIENIQSRIVDELDCAVKVAEGISEL